MIALGTMGLSALSAVPAQLSFYTFSRDAFSAIELLDSGHEFPFKLFERSERKSLALVCFFEKTQAFTDYFAR